MGADSVAINSSHWVVSGLDSIPGHGRHGVFYGNTWLSTLGLCNSGESENHVNVGPVSVWDNRTSENDKHPECDHPKVGKG